MNGAQFVAQECCYLCGSTLRSVEHEVGTGVGELHLRWVRCGACALVYLDPRPSAHALSVLYDSAGYWQGESGYRDYLADESWRRKQAVARAHWLTKRLRSAHPNDAPLKVLEIGSAAGYFLEALTDLGVTAEGLELSQPMANLAHRKFSGRVKVRQGFVEDAAFDGVGFQGLAVWGCDSNFDNPRQTFARFSQWLAPGGLLAMNFHQYDHWARHLKGRFKQMPNALYFMNADHVTGLLREHGLEPVEMGTESQWMSLTSVYHHTGHAWLKPLLKTCLADVPLRLPVPGSYRILARKL
jgi:SAM-dependent methyltransferase